MMNNEIEKITDTLGMFTIGLLGGIVYLFRNNFTKLGKFLLNRITIEFTIRNSDGEVYDYFLKWFNHNNFHNKIRRFRMRIDYGEDTEHNKLLIYPSDGTFFIFYRRRIFFIQKSTNENKMNNTEEFSITVPSFSKKIAFEIFEQMIKIGEDKNLVKIKTWDGHGWYTSMERDKRSLDTIFIDKTIKNDLVKDIEWFRNNKEWYKARGIPYYRGYLLYGPPGTGKTSLAFALACYFGFSLYVLNLNSIGNDEKLIESFSEIPKDSLLLLEDIDVMNSTSARNENFKEPKLTENDIFSGNPKEDKKDNSFGITLSGLLNAMDGVMSSEDRITIMTTNNPEILDKALLRAGRIDKKYRISYPEEEIKKEMFYRFFPDASESDFQDISKNWYERDMTTAELQELFLRGFSNKENENED